MHTTDHSQWKTVIFLMSTRGKTLTCRPVVLVAEFTFRQFYESLGPVGVKRGLG